MAAAIGSIPSNYNSTLGSIGGLIGAGAGSLFGGWENPANSAMSELDKIPDILKNYYDPYINAGLGQLPQLQTQYNNLLTNPGGTVNQIGQSFQQSPGFNFAMQQAMQGANHAAAAGGMAGSPQHQQQNMQLATNLANQDYYNWLSPALSQYNRGLSGAEGMYNTGYGASNELAQSIANSMLSRAGLQYAGTAAQNMNQQGGMGSMLGGFGSLLGFAGGGPAGAGLGGAIGSIGSALGF